MSLIKCTECGHVISDRAVKCPKCGCPTDGQDVAKAFGNESFVPSATPAEPVYYYEDDDDNNRKKWLWAVIALLLVIVGGGAYWWYNQSGEEREVKEFVSMFAKAVSTKDKMIIAQMYPDASKIDSLSISYNADSVVVEQSESNDTITVNLSASQSLRLMKDNGVNFIVVSSKGLLLSSADKEQIARKTGWLNPTLSDVANTERLNDDGFMPWLNKKAIEVMKANVKVVKSSVKRGNEAINLYDMGTNEEEAVYYDVVIENKNNCEISKESYLVKIVEKGYDYTWWADEGEDKSPYTEPCNDLQGKTIPKNGKVTYSWVGSCYVGAHGGRIPQGLKCKLVYEPSEQEAMEAYEPTGNEYEEYLEYKNKKK